MNGSWNASRSAALNLPFAPFANHVLPDGKGGILAVSKALGPDDAVGDKITRINRK